MSRIAAAVWMPAMFQSVIAASGIPVVHHLLKMPVQSITIPQTLFSKFLFQFSVHLHISCENLVAVHVHLVIVLLPQVLQSLPILATRSLELSIPINEIISLGPRVSMNGNSPNFYQFEYSSITLTGLTNFPRGLYSISVSPNAAGPPISMPRGVEVHLSLAVIPMTVTNRP